MTPFLQPADVAWMKPLKGQYFLKWNNWLVNAPKSFTDASNRKSPGYAKVIEWISEIWSDFDSSLIANSFDQCGITSKDTTAYSSQLRHFLSTRQLVDEVEPVSAGVRSSTN
jgi:hypothetical protein